MAVTKIPVGDVVPSGTQRIIMARDMTKRFGVLHEIQAINLRTWPRVFLNSGPVEVRYAHELRSVEFVLATIGVKNANLDNGLDKLNRATKWLLGVDVAVRVTSAGKAIFEDGPRDEQWLTPPNTSARKSKPSSRRGKKPKTSQASRRR